MATDTALLHKDRNSDFGVSFPDLPAWITAGHSLEQARGMAEEGERVPAPSGLDRVMDDPENRGAVVFLVDAPAAGHKSVRVDITLPETLLQAIDRASSNRSRFAADAAVERLKTLQPLPGF